MRKMLIAATFLLALNFFPKPVWADCVDFSRFTSWSVQGENQIVFYRDSVPFAVITLQDCRVTPDSSIRLPKTYLCDEDTIIVDGTECNVLSIVLLH